LSGPRELLLSDTGESATPYIPNRFETSEPGTSSAVAHNKRGYHRTLMTLMTLIVGWFSKEVDIHVIGQLVVKSSVAPTNMNHRISELRDVGPDCTIRASMV
ncbi:hypothetical protein L1D49_23395, partial [Vibrio diabolicus]|nr:hypothetical protein [Vibrio diabolicus]